MPRKFKTSKKKRTNYIYYSADGKKIQIIPNENGVTDAFIATIHNWDDEELKAERREKYHVPMHIDAYYDKNEDDAADRNAYLIDDTYNPLENIIQSIEETEHEEKINKLRAAIQTLKPQQKELIKKVFFERRTNVSIAAKENVSEAAIRKRLKKIYENLRKKI